jgi:hypothetical protein
MVQAFSKISLVVLIALMLLVSLTPLAQPVLYQVSPESNFTPNVLSAHELAPVFHVATAKLASDNATNAVTASIPYDEQIGMTFTQNFPSLSYNVTAVEQQDAEGIGPAYLLNGLSSKGFWYQVGLSWNWAQLNGGYNAGFHMNYNVFDSTGAVVFPSSGTGGSMNLSGQVNQGDIVGLALYFSNSNVVMSVYDWNTKATAQITYGAQGASQFLGLASYSNSNGFFSGLMTEQYHSAPYYGTEQKVLYSDSNTALSSGILWIDEYNVNSLTLLFSGSSKVDFTSDPTLLQAYSLQGARASANANNLITGSVNFVELTLSYSTSGGSGYVAPTLSYISNGFNQSVELTTYPTTYAVDSGTTWSLTTRLVGSSSTERWITNQTTEAVASTNQTRNFSYYHQYLASFNFSVIGGGSGYSLPFVTALQFGLTIHPALNQRVWIDANSKYSYTNPLNGSSQSERWDAGENSTALVSSSTTITPVYYHQFATSAMFSVANGGSAPTDVMFSFQSLGTTNSSSLLETPVSFWVDAGSGYNATRELSGTLERWITNSSTSGIMTSKASLDFIYSHQYFLTMQPAQPAGGSVNPESGWVNAGDEVQISGSASQGWRFEFWTGSGPGSYSGNSNATTIMMNGPVVENGTFYVGLTVTSSGDGSVSYSFGNSVYSTALTQTTYVPDGTVVSLAAHPSSLLYKLESWSGAVTGSPEKTSVAVTSPAMVYARFGYNLINIGVITAIGILVVLTTVLAARRNRTSNPKPS